MKKKWKRIFCVLLAVLMIILSCTACVLDQRQFQYIFDYWCTDWHGWYEITHATGKYAQLEGIRSDCTATGLTTYRHTYHMEIFEPEDNLIFCFEGGYDHEEGNKYGAIMLHTIYFRNEYADMDTQADPEKHFSGGVLVDFVVDGEKHGIEKLAVCRGTVGEGKDKMTMEFYLRHKDTSWEDLKDYTGDAFGGRKYADCLPEDITHDEERK